MLKKTLKKTYGTYSLKKKVYRILSKTYGLSFCQLFLNHQNNSPVNTFLVVSSKLFSLLKIRYIKNINKLIEWQSNKKEIFFLCSKFYFYRWAKSDFDLKVNLDTDLWAIFHNNYIFKTYSCLVVIEKSGYRRLSVGKW